MAPSVVKALDPETGVKAAASSVEVPSPATDIDGGAGHSVQGHHQLPVGGHDDLG